MASEVNGVKLTSPGAAGRLWGEKMGLNTYNIGYWSMLCCSIHIKTFPKMQYRKFLFKPVYFY